MCEAFCYGDPPAEGFIWLLKFSLFFLNDIIHLIYFFPKIFWAGSTHQNFLRRHILGSCPSRPKMTHVDLSSQPPLSPAARVRCAAVSREMPSGFSRARPGLFLWNGANMGRMDTELGPCWASGRKLICGHPLIKGVICCWLEARTCIWLHLHCLAEGPT